MEIRVGHQQRVFVVLLWCCFTTALEQAEIRLESIVYRGEAKDFLANEKTYDIRAESTVTVSCSIPGVNGTLIYPDVPFAKEDRFDAGARVSKDNETVWRLSNLTAYDTGIIECFDPPNHTVTQSIYLFVNDDNSKLYVERTHNYAIYIEGFRYYSYIPCLPINSKINVSMVYKDFIYEEVEIDPTKGVHLYNRDARQGLYTCMYQFENRTEHQDFTIAVVNLYKLPDPEMVTFTTRSHYLAGDKLELRCNVIYDNTYDLRWSYPAQHCANTSDCQAESSADRIQESDLLRDSTRNNRIVTLTVDHLVVQDSGNYTCAYRPTGDNVYRKSVTKEITVYAAPFLRGTVKNQTVIGVEGQEEAQLVADFKSFPDPPVIVWEFNSQRISSTNNDKYLLYDLPGEETLFQTRLGIRSLEYTDSGYYTLTATANDLSYTYRFELIVSGDPKNQLSYMYRNHSVSLAKDSSTVYFKPNKILDMKCEISGGVPTPNITWYWQDCDPLQQCREMEEEWVHLPDSLNQPMRGMENAPYFYSINPKSQFLRLYTRKSGWLVCKSSNVVGTAQSKLRMIVSVLSEKAEGVGFAEGTAEKAATLVEDDTMKLECYVSRYLCPSSDQVEIIGSGNEVYKMNSPDVLEWKTEDSFYLLSIQVDVTVSMTKYEYACRCRTGIQGAPVILNVQHYAAPEWLTKKEKGGTIAPGVTRTFLCKPKGTPSPTVSWYKDDKVLEPSTTILLSKDRYNLTVVRASAEDSGSYSCVGRSKRPDDVIYSNFTLVVEGSNVKLSKTTIIIVIVVVIGVSVLAILITTCVVRKYCRKQYTPHNLLLPSKDFLNPDIPLDEQTDALPYDIIWEFPIGKLKLGMLLGQGAFGRVFKAEAMNIEEGVASTTVAVKTIRDHDDMIQMKSLISELKILIHIGQHLNIVNLLGACTKDIRKGQILMIVEFCRYGNLQAYLLRHKNTFDPVLVSSPSSETKPLSMLRENIMDCEEGYMNEEKTSDLHTAEKPVTLRDIISWCYQMARGMEYLASIDYIHRDLAARNVLLADGNIVKICDFGLSKDIYKYQEYHKRNEGPLPVKWMALESLTHKVFNVKTDVWAYGITMWELFSLAATPYPGWEIDDTFIDKLKDGYRMGKPDHCPQEIYDGAMMRCWYTDPDKRPSFPELAEKMGEFLEMDVVERLRRMENEYVNSKSISKASHSRSSSSTTTDGRGYSESDYLHPVSHKKSNKTKANKSYYNFFPKTDDYYNRHQGDYTGGNGNGGDDKLIFSEGSNGGDDDVKMPYILAPLVPSFSKFENDSDLGSCSTSSPGSSNNASIPSYSYVMSQEGHRGSLESYTTIGSPTSLNCPVSLDAETSSDVTELSVFVTPSSTNPYTNEPRRSCAV